MGVDYSFGSETNTADLRVLVPRAAKSNGTLTALFADSIVMGPTSELGPIEPSIQGIPCSNLTFSEVKANNFPLHIAALHAVRQTQWLATRALSEGMMKGKSDEQIKKAIAALSTRDTFPAHGSVINRKEAMDLGLNITSFELGDKFWDSLWLLHCMYDFDLRRDGLAKIFEGNVRSLAVAAPVSRT